MYMPEYMQDLNRLIREEQQKPLGNRYCFLLDKRGCLTLIKGYSHSGRHCTKINGVMLAVFVYDNSLSISEYLHFHCEFLNEPLYLRCCSYLHEWIDFKPRPHMRHLGEPTF